MSARSNVETARHDLYDRMSEANLAPLWEVLDALITPTPTSGCQPALWHYDAIRPFIMEAGDIITAREAVRRVLVLENPGLRGQSRITTSLYAGLQLILPGEIAPAHRHSQSALRFIVEGSGAYTAVDGEKTLMHESDFVITPSWTWHDHGNDSEEPMVWLDGLDIPLISFLDTSFAENYADERFPESRPEGDALARYGSGLLPDGYEAQSATSPVFNYPYDRTREALAKLARTDEIDSCHGIKLTYVNPTNGDFAMPSMATFMQLLPKGFEGKAYRSSDATIFSVVEGSGEVVIGETVFKWSKRDTFVIPSWMPYKLRSAQGESVLFSFSDRAVQRKLGIWREQCGE